MLLPAAVEIVAVFAAALAAPVVVAAFAHPVVATSVAAIVDSAADVVAIASVAVASATKLLLLRPHQLLLLSFILHFLF